MYRSSGGGDANVPALPVRRSATSGQSRSTPQLPMRQQRQQQRSTTSSSSSSSRQNLANLEQCVDSSRVRMVNDYRDFPTTTTTVIVRHGDSHAVGRPPSEIAQTLSPPLPRDVGVSQSLRQKDSSGDDDRGKKENKRPGSKASECRESITCQRCGRCRCQECARHNKASGRRAVEICSCVCCVRRVVRHRQHCDWNDDEDPCACSPYRSHCCRRWALLVLLSVCLPCLCLYWPLRCFVGACSRCAGRQARGCRCVERYTSELSRTPSSTESIVIDRVTST